MKPAFTHLVVLEVVSLFSLVPSRAATILVPEDQPTIRACVDAAAPGDTCSIAPGVYYEDSPNPPVVAGVTAKILVTKPVTIRSRELFQAILDARDPSGGIGGFIIQADAHLEGLIIRNVEFGAMSRGNLDLLPVSWSASNLIITNATDGIGLDETGLPGERHSSSATFANITVDSRSRCYWTNDAGSLAVDNSIALNCGVGFEGCNHSAFLFSYSLGFGVPTIRRESCATSLPAVGAGFFVADPSFLHVKTTVHDFPYFLSCTSPAIDTGDPFFAYDDVLFPPSWGANRNDIGAYGGPGAIASLSPAERQEIAGQLLRVEPDGLDTLISWCNLPEATGSDLIRGDVQTLESSGGDFSVSTEECLVHNSPDTSFPFSGAPTPGKAFWFLVRCEGCPGKGTYDSGAPSQIGLRDAEIASSGNDCP